MFEYQYEICNIPDFEIFQKQCTALESRIPNLVRGKRLEDVDGSTFQEYVLGNKKLVVKDSYYWNAVVIESEFDLDEYFPD